jgi:2-desacetyl-2-hydroxyethyl bacteriochlorophyllide A dehydrogenase
MKAIEIQNQGKIVVVERPEPLLKSGHVLLRVEYVGFCGSDLNTFRGLNPLVKLPVVPGHEIGATVEAVADDVITVKSGMSVTVNPYSACGICPACRNFRPNACEHNQTLGVQRDGGMTERLLVPADKLITAEGVSVRDFALVEPMSVGFHAVERGAVKDTDVVVVIGCGMIGIGAIVRASLRGATVIAADVDEQKLVLARQLGATFVANTKLRPLKEQVAEITGDGRGADVVIEAVGSPETYLDAVEAAAFTARIVYIGYAKERVSFDTQYIVKKELDIRGSRNALPQDFRAVIKYLGSGKCPTDRLITAIYPPEEAQHALEGWQAKPGEVFRILIHF